MSLIILIILFSFFSTPSFAQQNDDIWERGRQRTLQDVIIACQGYQQSHLPVKYRDTNICSIIVELQQIGNDVIETIKTLLPLGPFEYFVATVVNFSVSGRLRAQLQPLIHPRVRNVIEYRREGEFVIMFSMDF
ncbi:MAG: hypothetical protein NZ480_08270 [Bdellovibrionaceae bacterium]|nr:hypothetical protein [Pseudobdellovibrionaceae bacterium]MDW8190920.1 hypothetical protein [Pseudobdellovibrionaceae bacterium]